MKNLTLVAIVTLLTFAGLSQTVCAENADYFPGVSILVESDKDVYSPNDSLNISVKIINGGPENLAIPLPISGVLAWIKPAHPTPNVFAVSVPLFPMVDSQFIRSHSTGVLVEGKWGPGDVQDGQSTPIENSVEPGTYLIEVNFELRASVPTPDGEATYGLPVKAQKLIYVEDRQDSTESKLDTIQQGVSDISANVSSTQAAVQDLFGVVKDGDRGIEEHLTKQDTTLNNIYSCVKKVYTYAYNTYNYAVKIFNLLAQVYNLLMSVPIMPAPVPMPVIVP